MRNIIISIICILSMCYILATTLIKEAATFKKYPRQIYTDTVWIKSNNKDSILYVIRLSK